MFVTDALQCTGMLCCSRLRSIYQTRQIELVIGSWLYLDTTSQEAVVEAVVMLRFNEALKSRSRTPSRRRSADQVGIVGGSPVLRYAGPALAHLMTVSSPVSLIFSAKIKDDETKRTRLLRRFSAV